MAAALIVLGTGSIAPAIDSSGASCSFGDVAVRTQGPTANAVGFTILLP